MMSELTKDEFEAHLSKVINVGPPWIMSSPLAIFSIFSNKLFYGEINRDQFLITSNSIWLLTNTYYIIDGKYRDTEDKGLEVDYQVRPLRFYYFLERIAIVMFIVLINVAFSVSGQSTILAYMIANALLLLLGWMRIKLSYSNKKRLETKFQQEFRLKIN